MKDIDFPRSLKKQFEGIHKSLCSSANHQKTKRASNISPRNAKLDTESSIPAEDTVTSGAKPMMIGH